MKSYNNLYNKLISYDNLKQAIIDSAKGKNKKRYRHRKLKQAAKKPDKCIKAIQKQINDYKPIKHKERIINDGINVKKRKIIVPTPNELKLQVKDNWQIFKFDSRPLDFLGFRFYRNHTGLRRKLALKMCRKANRIAKKPKASIHDARQMVTYAGYTHYADVYEWYSDHIKPCVNLRDLRKQISRYDKQKSKNNK